MCYQQIYFIFFLQKGKILKFYSISQSNINKNCTWYKMLKQEAYTVMCNKCKWCRSVSPGFSVLLFGGCSDSWFVKCSCFRFAGWGHLRPPKIDTSALVMTRGRWSFSEVAVPCYSVGDLKKPVRANKNTTTWIAAEVFLSVNAALMFPCVSYKWGDKSSTETSFSPKDSQ